MSKKLLFKGGHATGMIPYEIEDFSTLYMVDARVDEKTKAYIDSVIGNSVLNLCPYRNVLVTHKYDTVEGNVITLNDCQDDEIIQLSEVQGNTMVNCCKDGSKELTLNGDIDTSGYNNVTLTEGVDGGKVDISLEGNTMVNVCDQEDPIAITKNYEVTTGNHIALQGEYDGKCRPNIYGNTLWIDNDTEEILMAFDGTKNLRLQSSFEDKLITDEKDANHGKYKVDYKVTGKNKFDGQMYDGWLNQGEIVPSTRYKYSNYIQVPPNTKITLSVAHDVDEYDYNKNYIKTSNIKTIITSLNCHYIRIGVRVTDDMSNFQIEEGDTATTYEPYKEFTKTLYLNSPLLEGDTIEDINGKATHVHRYGKVVLDGSNDEKWIDNAGEGDTINGHSIYTRVNIYSNGECMCDKLPVYNSSKEVENLTDFVVLYNNELVVVNVKGATTIKEVKSWLQSNPITLISKLKTPTYETISNDSILCDSYVNGHLDVDSVIPIDKVVFQSYGTSLKYLSPNTEYTIQFESDSNGKLDALALNSSDVIGNLNIVKGINKFNITTSDKITINYLWTTGIGFNMSKIVVTPKVEQPFGYFKGMKSVGQDDENGHKIEILSQNKNLINFTIDNIYSTDSSYTIKQEDDGAISVNGNYRNPYWLKEGFFVEKGKKYSITIVGKKAISTYSALSFGSKNLSYFNSVDRWLVVEETFGNCITTIDNYGTYKTTVTAQNTGYITRFYIHASDESNIYTIKNIQIEKADAPTDIVPYNSNKKEILMNEPLRGLPNGVRDKYVIIDGKWYIQRNCGIDNQLQTRNWLPYSLNEEYPDVIGFYSEQPSMKSNGVLVCDKFKCLNDDAFPGKVTRNDEFISGQVKGIPYFKISIYRNKLQTLDSHGLNKWLSENNVTLIYPLATPTYELIEYNPFEVYSDITHISNNSIIPCNMVIKNSGYNCILKPSTLYTIALDTNKSGTIGINLGGVKGTTTNNVLKLTTPATLTDDSLRLYGKGIKGSKARLLEGDKTNWIPSHFEGMKSCFEDNLQDDGKYKVEVLCNNKNLFNLEIFKDLSKFKICFGTPYWRYYPIYVGKSKKVYLKRKYKNGITEYPMVLLSRYKDYGMNIGGWLPIIHEGYKEKYYEGFILSDDLGFVYIQTASTDYEQLMNVIENCIICTEDIPYEPCIFNKIQFLLNEPLRGVGEVKEGLCIKDNKLMVKRNYSSIVFDGSDDEKWSTTGFGGHATRNTFETTIINSNGYKRLTPAISNLFTNEVVEGLPINDGAFRVVTETNNDGYFLFTPSTTIIPYSDTTKWREWLQQNPITVVYQLETPVYEEVESNLSKLILEGYDHGTLFYDTNIPVTTQFYEFNVNIKDMLIPNETYYVTFNADRVKDITINLSGVQVKYKTSMGYNKVPVQLGDVVNTNFSMDSRGVELSDLMISTSTSLIYVKDMNDVCVYDEATNKYSITITSTDGKESDKRVILLDYPLLRLNENTYDRLYYSNKDSRYRIDKKVFKHKFTNDHEYSEYAAETNDTYYSSFISLNEAIKDYVVITNEKVKTVKVEDDKYYFKIKWSDLGVSDKTEANGNQGMKDFFNNNEVYLYYSTDGFVEVVEGLPRQTLKVYQPETFMKFSGNTTTTVTILIPMKNV